MCELVHEQGSGGFLLCGEAATSTATKWWSMRVAHLTSTATKRRSMRVAQKIPIINKK